VGENIQIFSILIHVVQSNRKSHKLFLWHTTGKRRPTLRPLRSGV